MARARVVTEASRAVPPKNGMNGVSSHPSTLAPDTRRSLSSAADVTLPSVSSSLEAARGAAISAGVLARGYGYDLAVELYGLASHVTGDVVEWANTRAAAEELLLQVLGDDPDLAGVVYVATVQLEISPN